MAFSNLNTNTIKTLTWPMLSWNVRPNQVKPYFPYLLLIYWIRYRKPSNTRTVVSYRPPHLELTQIVISNHRAATKYTRESGGRESVSFPWPAQVPLFYLVMETEEGSLKAWFHQVFYLLIIKVRKKAYKQLKKPIPTLYQIIQIKPSTLK